MLIRRVSGNNDYGYIEIRVFDASEENGVELEFTEYEFKRFRDKLNEIKVK